MPFVIPQVNKFEPGPETLPGKEPDCSNIGLAKDTDVVAFAAIIFAAYELDPLWDNIQIQCFETTQAVGRIPDSMIAVKLLETIASGLNPPQRQAVIAIATALPVFWVCPRPGPSW